jgi:hypothetical protein
MLPPEIEIVSPLEPAEVIANLRARGKEWRESSVPDDLRKLKVGTLCVSISDLRFDLLWSGNVSPFYNPVCSGTMEPTTDGTRIAARFRRDLRTLMPYFLMVAILIIQVAMEPKPIPLILLGIFLILFVGMAMGKRKVAPLRAGLIDILTTAAQPPVAMNPAGRSMSTNGP